jgi:hypothetical protein
MEHGMGLAEESSPTGSEILVFEPEEDIIFERTQGRKEALSGLAAISCRQR